MKNIIEKSGDALKEIIEERFYSPMYFYFIIAWMITNWKFLYVLFFGSEQNIINSKGLLKVEYISSFYDFSTIAGISVSLTELLFSPFLFSIFAVWILSLVSEKFYEKYEIHKMNIRMINRSIEYKEKFDFYKKEKEIREVESGDKRLKYDDCKKFNEYLDNQQDPLNISGITLNPSESLYNTDYQAYVELYNEWIASPF